MLAPVALKPLPVRPGASAPALSVLGPMLAAVLRIGRGSMQTGAEAPSLQAAAIMREAGGALVLSLQHRPHKKSALALLALALCVCFYV